MIINGYFRLNYHKLLVVIIGYYINGYWCGYFINGYCWLSYCQLLMVINGYSIGGY